MRLRGKTGVTGTVIIFSLIIALCPISAFSAKETKKPRTVNAKQSEAESDKKLPEAESPQNTETAKDVPGIYDYEKPVIEEESYAGLIFKTIIILGMLVGGFYYFFRFVTKKTGIHALGQEVIKILSIVPIGQNKFLQVVDIAGRILVLGVTDANISIITEVEGRDDIDRIRLLSSKSVPVQPGGFQQYVTRQLVRFINKNFSKTSGEGDSGHIDEVPASDRADRMDYLKKQRDRLKGLNGNNDEK
ncbi:MAG: flagellar biosynthetic protein FliO [Spirochaetes bacterium]|nr:flagellar biosynthetic protein FliO [Spirochaetota bacterium]